jgi:hypothetical protein
MADAPKGVPVNAEKTSLVDAVTAAYGEDPFDLHDDDDEAPEGTSDDVQEETPDAPEGAQPVVDDETPDENAETSDGTADLPERYFEVDLSGLPAEERVKILDALKGRDDEIGKLLRGRAEGEAPAEPEPTPEPEPITDEDILQSLGIDPEYDETAAKVALPLVRGMQQLQEQVQALLDQRGLDDLDTYWTTELDKLEAANGELPVDRLSVLEFAAENGLQSPADAYWRIYGPAQRQVRAAVEAATAGARTPAKTKPTKKEAASARPGTSNAEEEVPQADGGSLRDAVKEQTSKVLRDLGIGT